MEFKLLYNEPHFNEKNGELLAIEVVEN